MTQFHLSACHRALRAALRLPLRAAAASAWLLLWLACAAAGAQVRVLFIGDSVTDGGWGNSAGRATPSAERNLTDLNHLYGHSYMMLCAAEVESRLPGAGHVFMNRGISGDDLARLSARWQADALALRPGVISLLVGTNDVHYCLEQGGAAAFDAAAWEARYRSLLSAARDSLPGVRFVLGTPFASPSGWAGRAPDYAQRDSLTAVLARAVARVAADYGAVLLRYDSLFAALGTAYPAVPASHWVWDGIHPTPAGHRRMADLWLRQAGPLLGLPAAQPAPECH